MCVCSCCSIPPRNERVKSASFRPTESIQPTMTALRLLLLAAAVLLSAAAPVEQSLQDTLEEDEDMLLLLVPSVPIEKRSAVMDEKDVEYDLIAIPGEVLRREVKQTGHDYSQLEQTLLAAGLEGSQAQSNDRSSTGGITVVNEGDINNNHGFNINDNQDTTAQYSADNTNQQQNAQDALHNSLLTVLGDAQLEENLHDKRSFFPAPSTSNSGSSGNSDEGFEIGDFGGIFNKNSNSNSNNNNNNNNQDILRNVGTALGAKVNIATGIGRVVGAKFGGGSQDAVGLGKLKGIIKSKLNLPGSSSSSSQNNILGNVGQAFALGGSVVGGLSRVLGKLGNRGSGESNSGLGGLGGLGNLGGNIISGIRDLKQGGGGSAAGGFQSFTEAASGGFRYVGRLSTSLLRILLQIPGIKARVFTEIVQAGTPLKTAVSDVIGENADDMRNLIEAGTEIIRDAFDVVVRLVSDVLALKGRMLASFGTNGLDAGSSLFDGGLRIGGAIVQSAGDVASAVGRGVGEVVQVVSESDIPPLPQLPNLQLPNLGGLFNLGGSGSSSVRVQGSATTTNSKELFNLFGRKRR